MVCSSVKTEYYQRIADSLKIEVLVIGIESVLAPIVGEDTFEPVSNLPENWPLLSTSTSGTTSTQKRGTWSHEMVVSELSRPMFKSDDVTIIFKPYFWGTIVCTLFSSLVCGAIRVLSEQPFTPELQAELVEKYKVTSIGSTILEIANVVEYARGNMESVRYVACLGTPLYENLRLKIQQYLPHCIIANAYGSTECLRITKHVNEKPNSAGRLLERFKIKVGLKSTCTMQKYI